jgi:hypothetical protein
MYRRRPIQCAGKRLWSAFIQFGILAVFSEGIFYVHRGKTRTRVVMMGPKEWEVEVISAGLVVLVLCLVNDLNEIVGS